MPFFLFLFLLVDFPSHLFFSFFFLLLPFPLLFFPFPLLFFPFMLFMLLHIEIYHLVLPIFLHLSQLQSHNLGVEVKINKPLTISFEVPPSFTILRLVLLIFIILHIFFQLLSSNLICCILQIELRDNWI